MQTLKATIFDIDHFAAHDGPGIRTTVFFKGCPLRCKWCHSPESQRREIEIGFAKSRCQSCGLCAQVCPHGARVLRPTGEIAFLPNLCERCGRCAEICCNKAIALFGREYTLDGLLDELLDDQPFFENSGGGVTLTGGEVLMQAAFAYELNKALKRHGIHTLVETSGYGDERDLLLLKEATDLFYFDFKLWDAQGFSFYVGGDVDVVKRNLAALVGADAEVVLRAPMIHGVTDTEANICALFETAQSYGIRHIHLLPYNHAAPEKYAWLNRPFPLEGSLSAEERLSEIISEVPHGLEVQIV